MHLDATEHKGDLVFLHAVKPGPANQSYGLQVASLAGVPKDVIRRARAYLRSLENQQGQATGGQAGFDFSAPDAPVPDTELRDAIAAIDPDSLTPREALDALYELKKKLDEE